ncbi:hypothetical protein J19TS1_02670 [Heyndrickxia oleronia]|nr:hypothetical protein J19TS1_02670 [Heyndrickxia oleronia]
MLKRKFGDRLGWKRITEREYIQTFVQTETFEGYLSFLKMIKVTEPLYINYGEKMLCIADNGYSWLQQFPKDKHHAVTTMFNDSGEIIQWYIDICIQNGVENGRPFWDDLYLDLIVLPSGEMIQQDADELEGALASGIIDKYVYNLAWNEAKEIVEQIKEGNFSSLHLAKEYRDYILKTNGSSTLS